MRFPQPSPATKTQGYLEYDESIPVVMKPLEEEIWAQLRLMGVEGVVTTLLRKRFPNRRQGPLACLAKKLASCIRQADEYFWLAVEAPSRIAPLLHYYSMLNLAKALIYLESPDRLARHNHFGHGLTDPHRIKDPDDYSLPDEILKRAGQGIFPSLYAVLTGTELSQGVQYRLGDLLQYCAWISVELRQVFGVERRLVAGQFRLAVNSNQRTAWLAVEIPRSEVAARCGTVSRFQAEAPTFFQLFHRVAAQPDTLGFECDAVTFGSGPSAQPALRRLRRSVRKLRLYRQLLLSELSEGGEYMIPLQLDGADCLPEPCVLFAVTFYLGSLVRYQPHIYETMLGQEDAWLLESFIRQCPTCFSHIMLNHLWHAEYIFHRW